MRATINKTVAVAATNRVVHRLLRLEALKCTVFAISGVFFIVTDVFSPKRAGNRATAVCPNADTSGRRRYARMKPAIFER